MSTFKTAIPLLAAMMLLPSAAPAQDAATAAPPPDLPSRPFALPTTRERMLPNGLKVVVSAKHNVPLVTLRLEVPAGSTLDPPGQPGLAAAVASELTDGTDKYNSLQLTEAADRLGGSVSCTASSDYATVSASALSRNSSALLGLVADVVMHPAFPASELAIYRGLELQNLQLQRQNPSFLARQEFAKAVFGTHPYGVVSTTRPALEALTRQRLEEFYRAHYTPHGAVLVVVGDIEPDQAFALAERTLGGWTGPETSAASFPAPSVPTARTVYLVNRPGSVQSNIILGGLAINRTSPDYYALNVANLILGGGASSRLFADVREKRGFAYDVGSALDARALLGTFAESAQTRTDVTAPALQAMLDQASRLRTEPVSADELSAAKRYITGTFVLRLTTQAGLADALLAQNVYHLPSDYLTGYRDRINAITTEDVQKVAAEYLHPDTAPIVVVGDAVKLGDALKAYGNVETVSLQSPAPVGQKP